MEVVHDEAVCHIGGNKLDGGIMARLVYLDEAGTGKIDDEPYAVMIGVIVSFDNQIQLIEEHLAALKDKYRIDSETALHAKDIHHGSHAFDKVRYTRKEREELLTELLSIAPDFGLPVSIGYDDRVHTKETHPGSEDKYYLKQSIKLATLRCLVGIEAFMKNRHGDECCLLIFEESPNVRPHVIEIYKHVKSIESRDRGGRFFPISRIIETPAFAKKAESAILQVADAIAFAINRDLKGKAEPYIQSSIKKINEQVIVSQIEMLAGLVPLENIRFYPVE